MSMPNASQALLNSTALASAGAARVAQLKTQSRKQGEASFFFYDAHFKNAAVKVLPASTSWTTKICWS